MSPRYLIALSLLITASPAALLPLPASAAVNTRVDSPIHLPTVLPSPAGYLSADAFPRFRFNFPLAIASPPGEKDRLFVVEKAGQIQLVSHLSDRPEKSLFMDLPAILAAHNKGTLNTSSEWGLLGLAFHPDFARNGYLYIAYDFASRDPDGQTLNYNRLSRFAVSKNDPDRVDTNSEQPLITQLDHADNHNGGDVHFGPDGYLYYSMGDEGGGNDNFNNARFIDKDFFAAIYRLDVDNRPGSLAPNPHHQDSRQFPSAVHAGAYKIPADNPFVNATSHQGRPLDPAKIRTEIYCCGLRNPWRFSFDSATGQMFIADVGQDAVEEIDIGVPGGDYGWPLMEGTRKGPRYHELHPDQFPASLHLIDPIYQYWHGNQTIYHGNCVIGGAAYRGKEMTELFGHYIFADFSNRHIWSLNHTGDDETGKWNCRLLTNGPDVAGMGIDPRNGDVLFCHFGGGRIEHLKRGPLTGEHPPDLLSATGAFKDLATLTPNNGVVPYTPNVSFWSDHAIKSRWFSLPTAADTIGFSETGNYEFPVGTTFVKHFDIELRPGDPASKRRLETRLLKKTPSGVYGITYKWRPDNSDADLVPETGLDEPLTITQSNGTTRTQVWHYPARSECLSCHTEVAGGFLGFNTYQLNGPLSKDQPENQLQALANAGYFSADIPDPKTLQAFAKADDSSASLDWRVRSYLAVNCVSCHQPGGQQSNWDARPTSPNTDLLTVKLQDTKGNPNFKLIAPNDPPHSMLLQRIRANGVPRMPPLATSQIDQKAVDLLTAWISAPRP